MGDGGWVASDGPSGRSPSIPHRSCASAWTPCRRNWNHIRKGDVQVLLGQRYFSSGSLRRRPGRQTREGERPVAVDRIRALDVVTKANVDEYAKNWEKWS